MTRETERYKRCAKRRARNSTTCQHDRDLKPACSRQADAARSKTAVRARSKKQSSAAVRCGAVVLRRRPNMALHFLEFIDFQADSRVNRPLSSDERSRAFLFSTAFRRCPSAPIGDYRSGRAQTSRDPHRHGAAPARRRDVLDNHRGAVARTGDAGRYRRTAGRCGECGCTCCADRADRSFFPGPNLIASNSADAGAPDDELGTA